MRKLLYASFALAGLVCASLLVAGWVPDKVADTVGLPRSSLKALSDPALGLVALVAIAGTVFFFVYALRSGPNLFERRPWGRVLQLAFSGSVLLVATFILSLTLSCGGWLPQRFGSHSATGMLFTVALIQAGMGTVLAVVMFLMRPLSSNYAATVAVHLMEVAFLSVVFFLGYSA